MNQERIILTTNSKSARDNRANQLNPLHPAYYLSRGKSPAEAQRRARESTFAVTSQVPQVVPDVSAHSAPSGKTRKQSTSCNRPPAFFG
ncbi:hypothetical protein GCM10028813_09580 [Ramlibacter alkalitolerans]